MKIKILYFMVICSILLAFASNADIIHWDYETWNLTVPCKNSSDLVNSSDALLTVYNSSSSAKVHDGVTMSNISIGIFTYQLSDLSTGDYLAYVDCGTSASPRYPSWIIQIKERYATQTNSSTISGYVDVLPATAPVSWDDAIDVDSLSAQLNTNITTLLYAFTNLSLGIQSNTTYLDTSLLHKFDNLSLGIQSNTTYLEMNVTEVLGRLGDPASTLYNATSIMHYIYGNKTSPTKGILARIWDYGWKTTNGIET